MYKEIKEVLKAGGEFYEEDDIVRISVISVSKNCPREIEGRISKIFRNELGEDMIRIDSSQRCKALLYDITLKNINIITKLCSGIDY